MPPTSKQANECRTVSRASRHARGAKADRSECGEARPTRRSIRRLPRSTRTRLDRDARSAAWYGGAMLFRGLRWFVVAVLLAFAAGAALGCTPVRLVSAADLSHYGTRPFHQPKAEVVRATATALKTLGYEVTVADETSGKVKTSPKVAVIGAVRTSSYTAVGYQSAIAWSLEV